MIGPGYLEAMGVPIVESELVPPGKALLVDNQAAFRAEMRVAFTAGQRSALTVITAIGEGSLIGSTLKRDSLWSRYTAGAAEARRDRRRYG